jgi:competence protein ComEA
MNAFSRSQAAIVILASVILLVLYGLRTYSDYSQFNQSPEPIAMSTIVEISGKIRTPGIYSFDEPVSVDQAVARAGGLIAGLRAEYHWQTVHIAQGRRVHITEGDNGIARLSLGWMAGPNLLALGEKLDVNRASAEDLAMVPGISRRLAERIVARRQRQKGLSSLDDLLAINGIGPATLRRVRPYLKIN